MNMFLQQNLISENCASNLTFLKYLRVNWYYFYRMTHFGYVLNENNFHNKKPVGNNFSYI